MNPNQMDQQQFYQPMYPSTVQPIMQQAQQQSSTNVVVVKQPNAVQPREWSHSLFSCCDDIGECCCYLIFPCCYVHRLTAMANESCWTCCCLLPLRTKIRTERKINGSIVGDYCALSCCGCCAMLQMTKELRDTPALI